MKLAILGATGLTGRELVRQALSQAHTVTALVRNPDKLDVESPNLKFVKGDVTNYASVERIVKGQDAVISTLGASNLKRNPALTGGVLNVVRAMEEMGVQRLVYESAFGAGDSRKRLGLLFRVVVADLILRNAIADHGEKEAIVNRSLLDWIIVRPAGLTKGPKTSSYRASTTVDDSFPRGKISRADVAEFMLEQLTDDTYLRQAPSILY